MKRSKLYKLLSLVLTVVMVFGLFSYAIFATDTASMPIKKYSDFLGHLRPGSGNRVHADGADAGGADSDEKPVPDVLSQSHDGAHCVHHSGLAGAVPRQRRD